MATQIQICEYVNAHLLQKEVNGYLKDGWEIPNNGQSPLTITKRGDYEIVYTMLLVKEDKISSPVSSNEPEWEMPNGK